MCKICTDSCFRPQACIWISSVDFAYNLLGFLIHKLWKVITWNDYSEGTMMEPSWIRPRDTCLDTCVAEKGEACLTTSACDSGFDPLDCTKPYGNFSGPVDPQQLGCMLVKRSMFLVCSFLNLHLLVRTGSSSFAAKSSRDCMWIRRWGCVLLWFLMLMLLSLNLIHSPCVLPAGRVL